MQSSCRQMKSRVKKGNPDAPSLFGRPLRKQKKERFCGGSRSCNLAGLPRLGYHYTLLV